VGGGFLVLLVVVLVVVGLVVRHRVRTGPPGSAQLSRAEVVGTWIAPRGGRLEIRGDGTFTARRVCGFGGGDWTSGSDAGTWHQGGGEWLSIAGGAHTGGVSFVGRYESELDEGERAGEDVLWMFVGTPEESHRYCELRKR